MVAGQMEVMMATIAIPKIELEDCAFHIDVAPIDAGDITLTMESDGGMLDLVVTPAQARAIAAALIAEADAAEGGE